MKQIESFDKKAKQNNKGKETQLQERNGDAMNK